MNTTQVLYPQLSSNNFNNWKFRVKSLLSEKQIEDTLCKCVEDYGSEVEKSQFKTRDARARAMIVQCISDKHLDLIKDANTAKEMMEILQKIFERKGTFSKLHLRRKLLSLKCGHNEKLEDFFLKFDSVIRELEDIDVKMEESDKISHLLLSMNVRFEAVITAIETVSNKEVTIEFVKSRLLDEELKMTSKSMENKYNGHGDNEVAFKAFPFSCYRCGKVGHKIADCRVREVRSNSNYNNNNNRGKFRGRGHQSFNKGNRPWKRESVNCAKEEEISFIALSTMRKISEEEKSINLILDSGATEHLIQSEMEKYMCNVQLLEKEINIQIANGDILKATKRGELIGYYDERKIKVNGLIVEGLKHNLLAVRKIVQGDTKVIFNKMNVIIQGTNYEISCEREDYLYILKLELKNPNYVNGLEVNIKDESEVWHRRLGHLNRKGMRILGLPTSDRVCPICIEGKAVRPPFQECKKQSGQIGDLIHTDIAGPISPPTIEGYRYFQVVIDDFTHFTRVYLLRCKNEAEENLKDYIKEVKTQHNAKTKGIRLDNGREFTTGTFKDYCRIKGIKLWYTNTYTPQQNGKSERMNRTLLDKVRTKLTETKLPKFLWGEALRCSTYELNRSPTKATNNEPPAKLWYKKNDLTKLKIFGSQAWRVNLPRKDKLSPRAKPMIMVGYSSGGYRLWDSEENKIVNSRDVYFDETKFNYEKLERNETVEENRMLTRNVEQDILENEEVNENQKINEDNVIREGTMNRENMEIVSEESNDDLDTQDDQGTLVRRLRRETKRPKWQEDYETYTAYCFITQQENPEMFEEAVLDQEWKEAIDKEIEALEEQETWTKSSLPKNTVAIQTKWVFTTKEDGRKKARLVARGFQQKENANQEGYAPVARMSTIRMLLSKAINENTIVRQLDIPSAFLNGKLDSEVYIKVPKGVKYKGVECLKLNRALYGLKESPKCWNEHFDQFAKRHGFVRSMYDFCLYYRNDCWMIVYVDDILLNGKYEDILKALKCELKAKDLGKINKFLGMEITIEENNLKINQTKMINKILTRFKMIDCNEANTPMEINFQIEDQNRLGVPYRELIGSLMYLATTSRPDIMFSVSYLSRVLESPTLQSWKAAKRILRYLKGTKYLGLVYKKSDECTLRGYSDADWANDKSDRKSVSGTIIFFLGNPVSWTSRKQTGVALSTVEAEYAAAALATQDLLSLRGIMMNFSLNGQVILYMDNQGSISLAKSYENSKRSKHIDIKLHFIKDIVKKKIIKVEYVSSKGNFADVMTKALTRDKFIEIRNAICVK